MRSYQSLYFIVLLFLVPAKGYTQKIPPEFKPVVGTNGVSIGKITSITQDKFGYIWLVDQASQCLIRYDGVKMKIFRSDPRDTNSVNSSGFECIAADSSGGIWVDAVKGIDKFDPATEKFIHYLYSNAS